MTMMTATIAIINNNHCWLCYFFIAILLFSSAISNESFDTTTTTNLSSITTSTLSPSVTSITSNNGNLTTTKKSKTTKSGTRKPPQLLVGLTNSTSNNNSTRIHFHHHNNGNSGIGYGGEYAEEWPIYVAILGLTVFAYVAWVLVYCLCQRNTANGNSAFQSSSTSTSSVEPPELATQHSYSSVNGQNVISGRLSAIANGSYYHHNSNMSIPASFAGMGSPECSLEGASLHDMVPPKYLQAIAANLSLHDESANNTLLNCNDDFAGDGDNDTYIVVPRHLPSIPGSPPGYSDLTRISVVINPPSLASDDESPAGNMTTERSPLVDTRQQHQQTMARSVSHVSRNSAASTVATAPPSNNNRQFLQSSSPAATNWIRRSVARLHSHNSGHHDMPPTKD